MTTHNSTETAQSFDAKTGPASNTRALLRPCPPATGAPTIDDAGTPSHPEPFEGSRRSPQAVTPLGVPFHPHVASGGIDGGHTTHTHP